MRLASMAPFKGEMQEALRYLKHSIEKTGTEVITGKAVTKEEVLSQKPDAVIIATGSKSCVPDIPGIDPSFVFDVRDVYQKDIELGKNIVIIGGGDIGCETADLLSSKDKNITVVEMLDEPLRRMKEIPRQELLKRLKEKEVKIITNSRTVCIEKGKVITEDNEGAKKELMADSVIISAGCIQVNPLYDSLKGFIEEIYVIGDAKSPAISEQLCEALQRSGSAYRKQNID